MKRSSPPPGLHRGGFRTFGVLLLAFASGSAAAQQSTTISNLPQLTAPADGDLFVLEHVAGAPGARTSSLSASALASYVFARSGIAGGLSSLTASIGANGAAISAEASRAKAAEALLAPLASAALTGTPTAPTPATADSSAAIGTTAFVKAQGYTTAAQAAAAAPVQSVAGRTGNVALAVGDVSGAAPVVSPGLTGTPTAPTAAAGTNTTQLATTAFDTAAVAAETSRAQAAEAKALQAANNLSDVPAPASARTNLGLAAVAASGSASDLGTGTLPAARLPVPSTSTLGGVNALPASGNAFLTGIGTSGAPTAAQPSFANLSGSVAAAQMPALSGDVATSAGSTMTTIPAGTVTNAKMANAAASTIKGNASTSASAPADLTVAQAKTLLGFAASGANSDITALSGLTTALSPGQGGTGVTTAAAELARIAAVPTSTTVSAGTGLTGGGALSGNLTLGVAAAAITNGLLANAPAGTLKANTGGSAAAPSDVTPTALLDAAFGSTQGGVLYRGASAWTLLGPGSSGQVLGSGGAGANPAWQTAGGNGTVTSVALALPSSLFTVSGSPVTSSGTLTGALTAQAPNVVLAGPGSGASAVPTFRSLGTADLPMTALAYGGLKNRLINGAMTVDQRNSGAAVTLGTGTQYTVDRWFGWTSASPASETAQRFAVLSGGVAYAARLARASGATATATLSLGQVLETVPNIDLQGQTVTLSLKARAGANFSGSGLACKVATGTGTDQGSSSFASAGWTGYAVAASATFTLTTSFQVFALQATIPTGATEIGVSCGYTPSGTAGAADYADLSDVQLEPGAFTAAQVTFERRPLNVETALCQRFFVQWTTGGRADLFAGLAYSTSGTVFPVTLPVPMRTTPAINSSTIAVLNGSGSQVNGSSQAVSVATDKTVEIGIGAGGLTAGQASVLTIGTGSGGFLSLSAEL